mgnify:CR=1 FL=1
MKQVFSISEVNVCRHDIITGPCIHVSAAGSVNTSGWSGITLAPRYYIQPPADGLWDFDLIGDPPSGPVLQVPVPVAACGIYSMPEWLKGVRVHAVSNSVEQTEIKSATFSQPAAMSHLEFAADAGTRVIVRETIAVFDDSFQPTGMCSMFSVKMKKLRHEMTLTVEGPDEGRIRQCIAEAVGAGLLAAIAAAFGTGGGALPAAISAALARLQVCLGDSFNVRFDDRSHWIEWCT